MPTPNHEPFYLRRPLIDRFLTNNEYKFARVNLEGALEYNHIYSAAQREDNAERAEIWLSYQRLGLLLVDTAQAPPCTVFNSFPLSLPHVDAFHRGMK